MELLTGGEKGMENDGKQDVEDQHKVNIQSSTLTTMNVI